MPPSPPPAARIPLWIDLRAVPVNKRLPFFKAVEEVGAERVLLGRDDPHLDRAGIDVVRVDGNNSLKDGTTALGRYILLRSGKDQERAAAAEGLVVVEAQDWRVIPLENLIAERQDRPGTVFALADGPGQARLFRDTLEVGVDGIVLAPRSVEDIEATDALLRERGPKAAGGRGPDAAPSSSRGKASPRPGTDDGTGDIVGEAGLDASDRAVGQDGFLQVARVTRVADAGPGDRVCVDATSLFRPGEGLLVGSTARAFVLVHAETLETDYVRARPFRVNAGAVHSYLFAPGGRTRYLSELRAGDNVLAVHPDGVHRVLTVGRVKIERRPHTLVAWVGPGGPGSAILQTAETVRLVTPEGGAVAVTDLKEGDRLLVHSESAARHFGMAVDAALEER